MSIYSFFQRSDLSTIPYFVVVNLPEMISWLIILMFPLWFLYRHFMARERQPESTTTNNDFDSQLYMKTNQGDTADKWFKELERVHAAVADSPLPSNSLPAKVAILDTGVCLQHPLFKRHIDFGSMNKRRCKAFPKTLDPCDDKHGHGTHAASVLLQTAPNIELYIARVADDAGKIIEDNDYQGVINAIDWVVAAQVDVISISWGFPDDYPRIKDALSKAHSKNIVILVAAANHGKIDQIAFPARLREYVICIGAARGDGDITGFTAEDTDFQSFMAPGKGVLGAGVRRTRWGRSLTERKDGTSSATPIAAGVAALFIEYTCRNGYEGVASHKNMCKLFSAMSAESGDTYRLLRPWTLMDLEKVKAALATEIDLRTSYKMNKDTNSGVQVLLEKMDEQEKKALLKWLSSDDTHSSEWHRSIVDRRAEHSGKWFLDKFEKWRKDDSNMLLLCTGKAGAGKSFLKSNAIDYLRDHPDLGKPIYLYFNRQQQANLDLTTVARIILKQAAHSRDNIHPHLKTAFEKQEIPRFNELIKIFKDYSIECSRTSSKIFVLFDALDECDNQYFRQILELIRNLNDSGVRVYATARDHDRAKINRHFQTQPQHLPINAQVEDVKNYLTQELASRNTDEPDPEFEKEIVDRVAENVDGMFLLARLRLNHVLKESGKPFRRSQFDSFPVTEIEAYTQIMERIASKHSSKKAILRILSWLRYAQRLLRVDELQEIICVEDEDLEINPHAINDFSIDNIIQYCESLVTVDQTTYHVVFSHTTVRDFLMKSKFAGDLMSHAALAKTCLTYLNFEVFGIPCPESESVWARWSNYKFSEYAATYWAGHAQNANTEDAIWGDMLIKIVDTIKQDGRRESVQQLKNNHTISTGKSLLHILIESQLASYYMPPLSDKISNVDYTYVLLFDWWLKKRLSELVQQTGVDATDKAGKTTLCYAAISGQSKVVKWLIEKNAIVDATDENGQTAMYHAAMREQWEVMKLLIENKANVDMTDKLGQTVLHHAAGNGQLKLVKWLIENKAKVNVTDTYGKTELHHAAGNGQLDFPEGRSIGVINTDTHSYMSLHDAAGNRHLEVIKLLIENNADVETTDKYGETVLHYATRSEQWGILKLLIESNANVVTTHRYGGTALHRAAACGQVEIVKLLIEKNAKVDTTDSLGNTAMHNAARNGQLKVVKYLIEKTANVDTTDKYGNTILHYAAGHGQWHVVKYLIEKNVKVDTTGRYGGTALHYAASRGHLDVVKLLIEKNAKVDATDNYGKTALHHAAGNGHLNVVIGLIEKNAKMDTADKDGETALHQAARNGQLEVIKLLIVNNADVDTTGNYGNTILHYAASHGQLDVVQYLIEKNVMVDAINDIREGTHYTVIR